MPGKKCWSRDLHEENCIEMTGDKKELERPATAGERSRGAVSAEAEKKRICLVTTSLLIVKFFLIPHIRELSRRYDVTLIVNVDDRDFLESMELPVKVISVPIERKVALWSDIVVLFRMINLFRKHRFDSVHSISPKGGLLGMLAAWFSRVPIRIHTFQGEVWATRRGLWRAILRLMDRLVAYCATTITVVSHSERDFLIAEGIIPADKSLVLAQGSICGVDLNRFRSDKDARLAVRQELGIDEEAKVILFLGRITRDKGILDLAGAFAGLNAGRAETILLVVGPDEEDIFPEVLHNCRDRSGMVRRVGFTRNPERYMAAADLLCLPSYREGFGLVIIEAAAVGIPSVCSDIYGITDAVDDRRTGLLVPAGDVQAFRQALGRLIDDDVLRQEMARMARERAIALFSREQVTAAMLKFYDRLLSDEVGKFGSNEKR